MTDIYERVLNDIVEKHCPELSPERKAALAEAIELAMCDLASSAAGAAAEAAGYGP